MIFATGETLEFNKIRTILAGYARTPLGKTIVDALQPTASRADIERSLEEVAATRRILAQENPFGLIALSELPDDTSGWKNKKPVLEGVELYNLAAALREMSANQQVAEAVAEDESAYAAIAKALEAPDWIAEDILDSIDSDGSILDEASPELARLRSQLRKTRSQIDRVLQRFFDEKEFPDYVMDDFITIRNDRMVIPIKVEKKNRYNGIVHDRSRGGDSVFFEPLEAVELNNAISDLQNDISTEEARILRQLTQGLYSEWDVITAALEEAARLDGIIARARLADIMDAVHPELSDDGPLEILAARHPLLDQRLKEVRDDLGLKERTVKGREVVPIDLMVGGDWRVLVVTGPNAGGKTVSLKTAGLLAMMAQSGMHVPAVAYKAPVYNTIAADIGDAQDIIKNLSSFSSHMDWLRKTLEKVRLPALIMIDEISAATDPGEGAALAMATLEYLRDAGIHTLASTHLEALKAFAHAQDNMQNCAVEFDPDSLKPIYSLRYGLPGKSNALETAKEMGLPKKLLDRAYAYMGDEGAKTSEVIDALQREAARLRDSQAKVEEERAAILLKRRQMEEKLAQADDAARREIDKVRKEWREFRRHQDRALREAIEDSKQRSADEQGREQMRQAVRGRDEAFEELELSKRPGSDQVVDTSPLKAGDAVFLAGLGQEGTVEKDWNEEDGGPVQLQVRGKRLAFPRASIARSEQPQKKEPKPSGTVRVQTADRSARQELNLIGQRVEEALQEVERFIDDALVNGLTKLRIIHGRGTGRLRDAIEDYLKTHTAVATWAPERPDPSGSAVTEVELKN